MSISPKAPTDVDHFIAERIRHYRRARGMTQERLSREIGVSFQQVQKYENGANRVSAATLFSIASALGQEIQSFYPGAGQISDPFEGVNPKVTGALRQLLEQIR